MVHGCPSDSSEEEDKTYAKHWLPWIKDQLEKRGIKTEICLMPEPWHPDYEKFKQAFSKYKVNEDTILIGHSCGNAFLVRWLGDTKQKVKELIMVAPWKINDNGKDDRWRQNFYNYPIDGSIKDRVGKIIMFTSNDENPIGKQSLGIFYDALGGRTIELQNHGHYTFNDMGTEEFPELLKEI